MLEVVVAVVSQEPQALILVVRVVMVGYQVKLVYI